MNGGCQWGSSAGERRLSAGLTAKTKGLSITSDPRRATHATSATATPERTPCILFIPRARKPSCVINVPLNFTSSKPALGCSGTPGFPDSQGGSALVTGCGSSGARSSLHSAAILLDQAQSRAAVLEPVPSFPGPFLYSKTSSHALLAHRHQEGNSLFLGKSTWEIQLRQWRPWLVLAFAQDGAGRWPPPVQGVLGMLQPSLRRDTDVWKP